jgi:hypothetical protein
VFVGEQEPVRNALDSIEASGRQALVELRRMLGILRRGDEELALTRDLAERERQRHALGAPTWRQARALGLCR